MLNQRHIGPVPQIGYGTWNRDGQEAYEGVLRALELGYRHIDTAEGYHNEEFVGCALADSGVPCDEIFLTTKVAPENLGPGQVMLHARASLDRLGTDHVDLLLIHWPSIRDEFEIADYMGQLAEVQDAGLARHIGVSNFTATSTTRSRCWATGRSPPTSARSTCSCRTAPSWSTARRAASR